MARGTRIELLCRLTLLRDPMGGSYLNGKNSRRAVSDRNGNKNMAILLIAEHDNATLSEQTAKALSAALQIGSDVHALVAGKDAKGAADAAARLKGVGKVLLAEADELTERLAEPLALVVCIAGAYDTIAPATSSGKDVASRVAALLDESSRPTASSGRSMPATPSMQSSDAKKVITMRTASFPSASQGNAAAVENVSAAADPGLPILIENKLSKTDRLELTSAKIIISAGRALGCDERGGFRRDGPRHRKPRPCTGGQTASGAANFAQRK